MTTAAELVSAFPDRAALDVALDVLAPTELASLLYDWSFWRQPHQDMTGDWNSFGFLTGRGTGKTCAINHWLLDEVRAGRSMNVGLAAQDENKGLALFFQGEDGLLNISPPDFPVHFEPGSNRATYPNGAELRLYTPLSPEAIRGGNFDTFVADEISVWPTATEDAAWVAIKFALRRGLARLVWAATPKPRHARLRAMLAQHEADPAAHRLVRGRSAMNTHLPAHVLEAWLAEYGGTQAGRQELDGEFLDGAEAALFRQKWIDDHRRPAPTRYVRRGIGLDPAIATGRNTDKTGVCLAGLGPDGQAYVEHDYSGKYEDAAWAALTLDIYRDEKCDVIVAERNRGGDMIRAILAAVAQSRGVSVVPVKPGAVTRHDPRTVYLREVTSVVGKGERAAPVAVAYERGRVSHVLGAELGALEDAMCTYDPTQTGGRARGKSPDDMDAMVLIVTDLLGLETSTKDPGRGSDGLAAVNARLGPKGSQSPAAGRLGPLLVPSGNGRRSAT